jgi:hypothetical protein
MRAVLRLEFIGENYFAYQRARKRGEAERNQGTECYGDILGRDKSRPWVARVTAVQDDGYSFVREFMRGQIDYSQSSKNGSRGVYLYYPLKDGLYEVNARETWTRVRRYFIRVENTLITEIPREEVYLCLDQQSTISE